MHHHQRSCYNCAYQIAADLTAWQRISWWEGPDDDGHLWLMIDFRAAVNASRTHGPEMVARVLVSNVSDKSLPVQKGWSGCVSGSFVSLPDSRFEGMPDNLSRSCS